MSGTPLIDALQAYVRLERRRFHVPGHGGQWQGPVLSNSHVLSDWLSYDLTELDGLDALAHPEGVIAESQQMAATVFGALRTFYCVNGASVGIQAAMLVAFSPGDAVLVPRNAHRAVIAGLVLAGLRPVWFLPDWESDWGVWGGVSLHALETACLQHPDVKGLILTHPTYEGFPSEIAAIGSWCHTRNLRLIVDEAHGCLWPLAPRYFPVSALHVMGVDAVIHSLHKNGGSLTQTALLHLPETSTLDAVMMQESLNHLHTTSPSYLLMASIEAACAWLESPLGQMRLEATILQALKVKNQINLLPHWRTALGNDPMRYLIRHATANAEPWATALETEDGLSYETVGSHSTLYLRQLNLTPADDAALLTALTQWSLPPESSVSTGGDPWQPVPMPAFALPNQVLSPREAFFAPSQTLSAELALGRIARQTLVRCPPGIAVLVPGERIESHHLPHLPATVQVVA